VGVGVAEEVDVLVVEVDVEVEVEAEGVGVVLSQTHLALQPQPCFQQLPIWLWSPHDCHPVPGLVGVTGVPVTQLQLPSAFLPERAQRAICTKYLQVPTAVGVEEGVVEVEVLVVEVEDDELEGVGVSQTHLALQPQPCFQQVPILVESPHVCHPVPGLDGVDGVPVTQLHEPSAFLPRSAQTAILMWSVQVPAAVEVAEGAGVVDEGVGVVVSQTHLALQPVPCFQQVPILVESPHVCHPVPGLEGIEGVPETQLQFPSHFLPRSAQVAILMWSLQVPAAAVGVVVGAVGVPTHWQRALAVCPLSQHLASDVAKGHDVHFLSPHGCGRLKVVVNLHPQFESMSMPST